MEKTLEELIDIQLSYLKIDEKFKKVRKFITNDGLAAEFISSVMKDPEFKSLSETEDNYRICKARARHSALTFLLGMVFREAFSLFTEFSGIINSDDKYNCDIWMFVSLYHDKGYFSNYLKKENLSFANNFKYNLLQDEYGEYELSEINGFSDRFPKTFAYTYAEIYAYDKYAREFHEKNDDEERVDHGILGGIMVFDDYIKRVKKGRVDIPMPMLKLCCSTIAQHNIFKSSGLKYDVDYPDILSKLRSTSPFVIDKTTPLLLFLCLVDTVECVKKFGKEVSDGNEYFQTLSVLSSVKIDVSKDELKIDLTNFKKEIDKKTRDKKAKERLESIGHKGLDRIYENYMKSLGEIGYWTEFNSSINGDIVTITLK